MLIHFMGCYRFFFKAHDYRLARNRCNGEVCTSLVLFFLSCCEIPSVKVIYRFPQIWSTQAPRHFETS